MTVKSGKREIRPGSMGRVRLIFKRNYPRYDYTLDTPFRFDEWLAWTRAASPGRTWNYRYKGRV